MTDHRWLLVACLCAVVALGGCQVSVDTGDGGDVLGNATSQTYVIGIENETDSDVASPLREALAWWDDAEHEYTTAWKGEFVVRPDAEDPDLVARFAESVDCPGPAQACAPQFNSSLQMELAGGTMRFGLDAVPNRPGLVKKLKHELGHVRGVSHCQPPHWLMGCPDSARYEQQSYETRAFPWRSQTTLGVYLDGDDAARADVRAVLDEFEASPDTPGNLSLRLVDDPWHAHIVLEVRACRGCGYEWDVRGLRGGQSYDSDGELEFLYWADVTVTAEEADRRTGLGKALRSVLAPETLRDG